MFHGMSLLGLQMPIHAIDNQRNNVPPWCKQFNIYVCLSIKGKKGMEVVVQIK
jgi:hypothetical protein